MSEIKCCPCNIDGETFTYPRGDSFTIVLANIMTDDGDVYELSNTDIVVMDVRANLNNELLHRFELTKQDYDEEKALNFVFSSDITRNAKRNSYSFDIRLIMDGNVNNVVTIVNRVKLTFIDAITEVSADDNIG